MGRTTRCSCRATTSSRARDVHERLLRQGVDVYASAGVTDARDSFGYLVYVREDQFQRAVDALGL